MKTLKITLFVLILFSTVFLFYFLIFLSENHGVEKSIPAEQSFPNSAKISYSENGGSKTSILVIGDSTSQSGRWAKHLKSLTVVGTRTNACGTNWVGEKQYSIGDVVRFHSVLYRAKSNTSGLPTPPMSNDWVDVWSGNWESEHQYQKGEMVRFKENLYLKTSPNEHRYEPDTENSGWEFLAVQSEAACGKYAGWFLRDKASRLDLSLKYSDNAIVMLGINDLFKVMSKQLTIEQAIYDLLDIVDRLQGRVLVVLPPKQTEDKNVWERKYPPVYNYHQYTKLREFYTTELYQAIKADQQDNRIKLLRLDHLDIPIADAVHPTEDGYKIIAQNIEKVWHQ